MLGRAAVLASSDGTYRPTPFKTADLSAGHEDKVRRLFEERLPAPSQRSEFDEVFGEDPLDFLMSELALPIYEAETHRAMIERRGRVEKKIILPPAALGFHETEQVLQEQWTEQTCPEEHYFKKFLNRSVQEALSYALDEADRHKIVEDHRAFKLFCPLDHMAEHLWTANERHPERDGMQQKDIPIFAEFFEHFPRPEPPLHLKLTTDQAAVIIQKRWKGTITRRRPDIKALRRHIAAARIQYNDPRRLVEELWNRDIPIPPPPLELSCVSLSDNNPVHSPQIGSLTDVAANTRKDSTATPALPKFLQISKTDVQNRLTQSRGKTEGQRKKASPACEKNKDSGDSDEEPEEKPVPVEVAIVVPTAPPLPDPAPSNPLDGTGTSRNSLNKAGAHGGGLTADGLGKGGGPSMVPKTSKDKQVTGSGGEKKAAKAPKAK